MVIANTSSGETHSFDLTEKGQLDALTDLIGDGRVTALAILHRGVQHALTLPRRCRAPQPQYGVELLMNGAERPVGERIYYQVDTVLVSVSATFTGSVVRCDTTYVGRQRFRPRRRK